MREANIKSDNTQIIIILLVVIAILCGVAMIILNNKLNRLEASLNYLADPIPIEFVENIAISNVSNFNINEVSGNGNAFGDNNVLA